MILVKKKEVATAKIAIPVNASNDFIEKIKLLHIQPLREITNAELMVISNLCNPISSLSLSLVLCMDLVTLGFWW